METLNHEIEPGIHIEQACDQLVERARLTKMYVRGEFNGVDAVASPTSSTRQVWERYQYDVSIQRPSDKAEASEPTSAPDGLGLGAVIGVLSAIHDFAKKL